MSLLLPGLALWSGAHLLRRLAPNFRDKLGEPGKGLAALLILTGIILMALGYRAWDSPVFYWGRHSTTVGINNLLMLLSVYMFAASGMKTALARWIRHPMLGAVVIWALAHLLVNGDLPSIVLFGGLLLWAVVEMIAINRAEPEWIRPEPAPRRKEFIALGGSVVVYLAIAQVHYFLGYPAFG